MMATHEDMPVVRKNSILVISLRVVSSSSCRHSPWSCVQQPIHATVLDNDLPSIDNGQR